MFFTNMSSTMDTELSRRAEQSVFPHPQSHSVSHSQYEFPLRSCKEWNRTKGLSTFFTCIGSFPTMSSLLRSIGTVMDSLPTVLTFIRFLTSVNFLMTKKRFLRRGLFYVHYTRRVYFQVELYEAGYGMFAASKCISHGWLRLDWNFLSDFCDISQMCLVPSHLETGILKIFVKFSVFSHLDTWSER